MGGWHAHGCTTVEFFEGQLNDVFADMVYRIDVFGGRARIILASYMRQRDGTLHLECPISIVMPVDQLAAIGVKFCKQYHDLLRGGEAAPANATLN